MPHVLAHSDLDFYNGSDVCYFPLLSLLPTWLSLEPLVLGYTQRK